MRDAALIVLKPSKKKAIGLHVIGEGGTVPNHSALPKRLQAIANAQTFNAAPLTLCICPDANGDLNDVLVGAPSASADAFALGSIASKLPPGHYRFDGKIGNPTLTALAWCLELYRYDPYRPVSPREVTLECPQGADITTTIREANMTFGVRDLVNTPSNLLGPDELETAARKLARRFKCTLRVTKGSALERNFPFIHIVGAASDRKPRLLDFSWGNPRHPKVTLVGKGVCFDTGGLDIKPSAGMLLMKKDMGGAASVLGLAELIMASKLPVRLRVLIPAVENAISGNAFRPGDVFKTRKGLTVEIGNTDAEGRLILCEALALADEEKPDMLIDMATLTGAARVALGPDLPPFYTDNDELAADVMRHGFAVNDPVWRLPLWRPYAQMIESPVADINNAGAGGFAGSITAALFLRRFVENAKHHLHFDIFAWTGTVMEKPLEIRAVPMNYNASVTSSSAMPVRMTIAQALTLLSEVSHAQVVDDEPDLSVRQMAILLIIYMETPPHTVRGLAARLQVSKPVITRALDTMGKLDLVKRRRDEKDRRNVIVQRTVHGSLYLERLADIVVAKAADL
jgi:leucyl aminopeptidase